MTDKERRSWGRCQNRRAFLKNNLTASGAALLTASAARGNPSTGRSSAGGPGKLRKVLDLDLHREPQYYYGPGPSPAIYPDGEIVIVFRRHVAAARTHTNMETENCVMSSRDNGKTWSTPRVIDYGGVHNPNLTLLRDGSLLYATALMEAVTQAAYEKARAQPHERVPEGGGRYRLAYKSGEARLGVDALISGVAVRRSTDRGRTWSPRFMVSPIEGVPELIPGWPTPANLRSPVVQLRNGKLILPVYTYPNPWRVVLMASEDLGKSWTFLGEIAGPGDHLDLPAGALVDGLIAYNETFVQETLSGKLVAFIRIHAGATETQKDQWDGPTNPAGQLVTSTSHDGGRTWSPVVRHQLWGYPYWAMAMRSGRVLLAYGYRQQPFGVRVRLLDPECEQIDEAEELVVRDNGAMRDLGYPQGALLTDGRVFLAYYLNDKSDNAKQIYLAASILEEV